MICYKNIFNLFLALVLLVACGQGGGEQKEGKPDLKVQRIDKALEALEVLEERWLADYIPIVEKRPKDAHPWIEHIQLYSMKKIWKQLEDTQKTVLYDRIVNSKSTYSSLRKVERFLVLHLVEEAAEAGRKEELVKIISTKCPERFFFSPFEMTLIWEDINLVLVFIDAYKKSSVEETKKMLFYTVQECFWGNVEYDGKDKAAFLEQCEDWFRQNSQHIELNTDYSLKFHASRGGLSSGAGRAGSFYPLFKIEKK